MRSCWVNWKAVINCLEAGGSLPWFICMPRQPEPHSFLDAWGSPAAQLLLFLSPSWISFTALFSGLAAALVIVLYSCILHNNWGINRSPFQSLLQQVMFCVSKTFLLLSSPSMLCLRHRTPSPIKCFFWEMEMSVCPLHIKLVVNGQRKSYMFSFSYYLETLCFLRKWKW